MVFKKMYSKIFLSAGLIGIMNFGTLYAPWVPTACYAARASENTSVSGETENLNSIEEEIRKGEVRKLGSVCTMDLDQDGMEETISFAVDRADDYGTDSYTIQVGNQSFTDIGENIDENLYGISLDGSEILLIVHEYGPSDDPLSTFFRYDGSTLSSAGQISSWPENFRIENGKIKTKIRCNVMGTLAIETQWQLNEEGVLTMERQGEYKYGADFTYPGESDDFYAYLKEPLTVYKEHNILSETEMMNPQKVRFPYTDGENWAYVEGESGQGGWIFAGGWPYNRQQEVFDGLKYFD